MEMTSADFLFAETAEWTVAAAHRVVLQYACEEFRIDFRAEQTNVTI
jgi:hypothetical protein